MKRNIDTGNFPITPERAVELLCEVHPAARYVSLRDGRADQLPDREEMEAKVDEAFEKRAGCCKGQRNDCQAEASAVEAADMINAFPAPVALELMIRQAALNYTGHDAEDFERVGINMDKRLPQKFWKLLNELNLERAVLVEFSVSMAEYVVSTWSADIAITAKWLGKNKSKKHRFFAEMHACWPEVANIVLANRAQERKRQAKESKQYGLSGSDKAIDAGHAIAEGLSWVVPSVSTVLPAPDEGPLALLERTPSVNEGSDRLLPSGRRALLLN